MRVVALREFTWEGEHYKPGDRLEILDGHPRLRVMLEQSKHIIYDNTADPPVATKRLESLVDGAFGPKGSEEGPENFPPLSQLTETT